MRRKVIIGNWKMNKTIAEAVEFTTSIIDYAKEVEEKGVVVGICPTFLSLPFVKQVSKDMLVAAQTCHYAPNGAFTGEVSIPMLKELDIKYCLIGHSERRQYNNETNQSCNKKLIALYENDITPVYCVGENLAQYEQGLSKQVVETQVIEGLAGLSADAVSSMIVAYEPVWSIGTGKNASCFIAEDICGHIRKVIEKHYGSEVASKVIIQYGGSVKADNAKEYLSSPNIDGVLVGGASLEVESFKKLISSVL